MLAERTHDIYYSAPFEAGADGEGLGLDHNGAGQLYTNRAFGCWCGGSGNGAGTGGGSADGAGTSTNSPRPVVTHYWPELIAPHL